MPGRAGARDRRPRRAGGAGGCACRREAALAKLTSERAEAAASAHPGSSARCATPERRGASSSSLPMSTATLARSPRAFPRSPIRPRRSFWSMPPKRRWPMRSRPPPPPKGRRRGARGRNRARPPLQEARGACQRIETEARTLAKLLNAASGGLFPVSAGADSVDRGFETALGAALGDDLDAPLDRKRAGRTGATPTSRPATRRCRRVPRALAKRGARAAPACPPSGADRHCRGR
jgi:chromosome segregation protein